MSRQPDPLRLSRRHFVLLAGAWLVLVTLFAVDLVFGRHLQVDEFQNAYHSRLLVVPGGIATVGYVKPYMVPLGYLSLLFDRTAPILLSFRLVFFGFFLLNLLLLAFAPAGFSSRAGRLFVLAGASLLYPLWKFGFEIRHDVLIATGNLALFLLTQRALAGRLGPRGFACGGAVAVWTALAGHKAVIYALPFSILFVAAASPDRWWRAPVRPLARAASWWAIGAAAALSLSGGLVAITGHFGVMTGKFSEFFVSLGEVDSFSSWPNFAELAAATPVVTGAAASFMVVQLLQMVRTRQFLHLTPSTVTAVYLVWTALVFFKNPNPYPYNALHLLPFVFLAAADLASRVRFANRESTYAAGAAVLAALLVSWILGRASDPYNVPNEHQLSYIELAEELTGPDQHVVDGVGMVLTRLPADAHWHLHSAHMSAYRRGQRTSFAEIIERSTSPVAITNYRWTWLPPRDRAVLEQRYVQLGRNFYVLGANAAGSAGEFSVHAAGRYQVVVRADDSISELRIDGQPVAPDRVLALSAGAHHYRGAPPGGMQIVWLGPRLPELPLLNDVARGQHIVLPHF
jgi:hypothetical protein